MLVFTGTMFSQIDIEEFAGKFIILVESTDLDISTKHELMDYVKKLKLIINDRDERIEMLELKLRLLQSNSAKKRKSNDSTKDEQREIE